MAFSLPRIIYTCPLLMEDVADHNVGLTDPIHELLESYFELNSSRIDELHDLPSALEFMRFVATNRPFVVRGGAADWKATKEWSVSYLKEVLRNQHINVAVTPHGNADSPTLREDGSLVFVKPWEEEELFDEFLDYLTTQEKEGEEAREVRYAQTQNDNLRGEYVDLFSDVEKDIHWARIALEKDPEAINLWIGNSRSVTALHKDNYENIYCQIIGEKHFVLLPPLTYPCIGEQPLRPASYARQNGQLEILEEKESEAVPFPTWDPDEPEEGRSKYSDLIQPMRVTLEPGDMLYLPAAWYHKVSQSCSPEGLCCAVNYWYDMAYEGHFFPSTAFVRNVVLAANQQSDSR